MSQGLLNKATWLLLAVTVTVLNSAEPAGDPCSVADLDGDCDVDLADFRVFQGEFTGMPEFEPVGGMWDVFYPRLPTGEAYYYATLLFYANDTLEHRWGSTPQTFAQYHWDGVYVEYTAHGVGGPCSSSADAPPYQWQFVDRDTLASQPMNGPNCSPNTIVHAYRRY